MKRQTVCIDEVKCTHRHEVYNRADRRMEHERESYHFLESCSAGELYLGNGICGKRTAHEVTEGTADGDEHRIEYVSGERNPRVCHRLEHIGEVLESRVCDIKSRRVHPELVKRLERLDDSVVHRDKHEESEKHEEY